MISMEPLEALRTIRHPVKVLANAEFDSERNHQHIRHVLQAYSVMAAKRGTARWKIQGM